MQKISVEIPGELLDDLDGHVGDDGKFVNRSDAVRVDPQDPRRARRDRRAPRPTDSPTRAAEGARRRHRPRRPAGDDDE